MRLARSRENTKRAEQKTTRIMVHWRDEEVRELLTIRSKAEISRQIVGTARDSVVYDQITEGLRERGIVRTKAQVNTKLKALKKQYQTIAERDGNDPEIWCYLSLCEGIWGKGGSSHSPPAGPVALVLGQETTAASTRRSPEEEPSSPSTPEPPSSDNDEKPPVPDHLSLKDSGCSTEWTVPVDEPPRKKSRNWTNLERQSAELRRVFHDMDGDFHERERLRLLEERQYAERWRRERQEREERRHREEMAVLRDLTAVLRQMAHAAQQPPPPPPLPSSANNNNNNNNTAAAAAAWSQERVRQLEERELAERVRREEHERDSRQRREEMAVLRDLTATLRQVTQALQPPPPPLPPHPHPHPHAASSDSWSAEQLQLLQE